MCSECKHKCKDRLITIRENKSSFIIDNSQNDEINVIKVDGCKINEGIRCDWLFVDAVSGQETFVELKGTGVEHGFEQIEKTIGILSQCALERKGVIVCTRNPLNSTQTQKLKIKARKSQFDLQIKSSGFKCKARNFIVL